MRLFAHFLVSFGIFLFFIFISKAKGRKTEERFLLGFSAFTLYWGAVLLAGKV